MTTAKLTDLWDAAIQATREAFREAGRKGSANHAEILELVQDKHYEIQMILREEADQVTLVAKVNSIITDTITAQNLKGGTSIKKALTSLSSSATARRALADAAPFLIQDAAKEKITRKISSATVSEKKAEATARWHAIQPEFAFENIEEFRGLPQMISFLVESDDGAPARIEQIAYKLSNQKQRESSLALKKKRLDKNQEAYNRENKANQLLAPLVKKYGDIPPPDLWARKIQDEQKRKSRVN